MPLLHLVALSIVVLAGLFLLTLGAALCVAPSRAGRFLLGFASTPAVHYAELSARLVVGAALVIHSPRMYFASAFAAFGWVVLVTTAVMLLLPWHWHRHFAQRAVPHALRFTNLLGMAAMATGGLILGAVIHGNV